MSARVCLCSLCVKFDLDYFLCSTVCVCAAHIHAKLSYFKYYKVMLLLTVLPVITTYASIASCYVVECLYLREQLTVFLRALALPLTALSSSRWSAAETT
eukprot:scpid59738/ scgid28887/ 